MKFEVNWKRLLQMVLVVGGVVLATQHVSGWGWLIFVAAILD